MAEGELDGVAVGELDGWLSELSQTLRTSGQERDEQAAHLQHCLRGIVAALDGEVFPRYDSDAPVATQGFSSDDLDALISSGEEMEAAVRGVLREAANQESMRKADEAFDSLFKVAGYVSLTQGDPDAWAAEVIRRSVPKKSDPAIKAAADGIAAIISPPLIGWTNTLTKMLGEAVAAGRVRSLERALDRAVERSGRLLGAPHPSPDPPSRIPDRRPQSRRRRVVAATLEKAIQPPPPDNQGEADIGPALRSPSLNRNRRVRKIGGIGGL